MFRLIVIVLSALYTISSFASDEVMSPKKRSWSFDGAFGSFDKQSVQRGFQVYKEVCATCHSLELVSFRNLEEIGLTTDEVKALASQYQIKDGPNDEGEYFTRPGKHFDRMPSPYPNEKASRAANNGAYPLDLSLIIKARSDGANYVYSLLTGYNDTPPAGFNLVEGMYYNPYFPGKQIAMPPPLSDSLITYLDGTNSDVEQMSVDVVNFLQWAAEPEMEKRKVMGIKVIVYLLILALFLYFSYKRIWSGVK
ncbi:MAG: cytochrome c1 [Rickettsiales bacterium]